MVSGYFEFHWVGVLLLYIGVLEISLIIHNKSGLAFWILCLVYLSLALYSHLIFLRADFLHFILTFILPGQLLNLLLYSAPLWHISKSSDLYRYKVRLPHRNGTLTLQNIRRGISIIGSAGSGKTESIVFNL